MFFSNSLVAVDIGSSAIKVLELTGGARTPKLKNFAIEVLPKGAIANGTIQQPEAVVAVLRKMVSRLGLKGRRASISVSGGGVILKRIRINAGRDATVDEQVNFHAGQAFQLDLADIYFDYVAMGDQTVEQGDADVLLVGARRELVELYVSIINQSGLKNAVIEAGALSVFNMFELNYGITDELVALISIGATHTQISFARGGRLLYCHEVPVGGDAYTAAIMQGMNLPWETAEALKISLSGNAQGAPPELRKIMSETNNLVVSDIRQIFNFFATSSDSEGVGNVKFAFLTGGACRSYGLDAAIASSLGVPVNLLNPFQRVDVQNRRFNIDLVMGLSPLFGVAVGLGVREKGDKVAA